MSNLNTFSYFGLLVENSDRENLRVFSFSPKYGLPSLIANDLFKVDASCLVGV